jgi:ribosomal protein S4
MVIKRYKPRYKRLVSFRHPLFYEKRGKIIKFNRSKWHLLKRLYFLKKFKFFKQDVSVLRFSKSFFEDNIVRLKKTYKFLLQDKQKLQFYFGSRRMRYFNLKRLAKCALRLSLNNKVSPGASFLFLLDNRLINILYRLNLVPSALDAKRLIDGGHVCINGTFLLSSTYILKKSDMVILDPAICFLLYIQYLRFTFPFFYFRRKKWCCKKIFKKFFSFFNSFVVLNQDKSLLFLKFGLENVKVYLNK